MRNPVCWLTRRRLGAYRDGELGPAAGAKVEVHLARCPDCAADLAVLGRLRVALSLQIPEPPEAVWDAFWPQVRARMAAAEPAPRGAWDPILAHPRLAFGSVVAAAALALLAVLAPWRSVTVPEAPKVAQSSMPGAVVPVAAPAVVVHSVETAAPDSSVMVFDNPAADVTVVWVFGLERTDI